MRRRTFLQAIAGLALAPICPKTASSAKWEAEYEIGAEGMQPILLTVFSDGEIGAVRGNEVLLPLPSNPRGHGWKTFRGKYGTSIRCRRVTENQLNIDYLILAEPK